MNGTNGLPVTLEYATPRVIERSGPDAVLWVAAALVWTASATAFWLAVTDRVAAADPRRWIVLFGICSGIGALEAAAVWKRSSLCSWLIAVPAWIVAFVFALPCVGMTILGLMSGAPTAIVYALVPLTAGYVAYAHTRWANRLAALADGNGYEHFGAM